MVMLLLVAIALRNVQIKIYHGLTLSSLSRKLSLYSQISPYPNDQNNRHAFQNYEQCLKVNALCICDIFLNNCGEDYISARDN